MTSAPSNRLKAELGNAFDWTAATVKLLLIADGTGHAFDPDVNSITPLVPFETTVALYARGAVGGRSITRDDAADLSRWLADNVVFPTLGTDGDPAIAGAYLYVDLGDDATSWPLAFLENVAGFVNGTDWTASFDPLGVVRIIAAA